jgi:hypothetical protein
MRGLLVVLILLCVASTSLAQSGTPVSWRLQIYLAGGGPVGVPVTVTKPAVQCGQTRPAQANTLNPVRWRWFDTADKTKDCLFDDAVRLQALPDGQYEGTITAINADGPAAEGPRLPFERRRPNPPAVAEGGRVVTD